MVKPFGRRRAEGALRALLRRAAPQENGAAEEPEFAEIRLDSARHGAVVKAGTGAERPGTQASAEQPGTEAGAEQPPVTRSDGSPGESASWS